MAVRGMIRFVFENKIAACQKAMPLIRAALDLLSVFRRCCSGR
jgi:hypothetical protein